MFFSGLSLLARCHPPSLRITAASQRLSRSALCWRRGLAIDFLLNKDFVKKYEHAPSPFGFNGLGEVVYLRTYSRRINDNEKEKWYQTVERKQWLNDRLLPWNEESEQRMAEDMYERIFEMKFLPPGRGLWAMGSPITTERKMFAALNNCAFVSTIDLNSCNDLTNDNCDPAAPFCFLMDASMLGVGVGFDTLGAGVLKVQSLTDGSCNGDAEAHVIHDSREGWVDSVRELLNIFLHPHPKYRRPLPSFDYSSIRPAGSPIKGFGGTSQGPGPLKELHSSLVTVLGKNSGRVLSVTSIVDIMNLIGKCVIAGNVRRTAEIAFGDPGSEEYIDLKNYDKNPHRQHFGWTSNNSVFASLGMDYAEICERVCNNGEPGFAWLENMQAYSRMNGKPDYKDIRARGGNPCLEQTLESNELCCLVETFPAKHSSLTDYLQTLRAAFLYAKIVTLTPTHWSSTNAIMTRNRRVGTSMSGIAQFLAMPNGGIESLRQWCTEGYNLLQQQDKELSQKFGIPTSIKTTCIKPSGTVSLLAGATPGMHFPESRFYIRRIRLAKSSNLVVALQQAGFNIEVAMGDEDNTVVVEFPIDAGQGVRTLDDVQLWEQLGLAAFLQRHWADNQVSCTVTFDPKTEGYQLPNALDVFQYQLKGVSFLPREKRSSAPAPYPQMPYESINESRYNMMMASIDFDQLDATLRNCTTDNLSLLVDEVPDKFCDSAACSINSSLESDGSLVDNVSNK